MKKFLLACGAAAMMLSVASCGGSAEKGATDETKSLSDSLSIVGGQSMGLEINQQWQMFINQQPDSLKSKYNKKDFLRGFQAALKTDTTNQSYIMGFNVGLNGWNFALRQNATPVRIDLNTFYKEFEKSFMLDSIAPNEVGLVQSKFQSLMGRIQEAQMKVAQEAKAKSPEAVANKNAGEAYVKKMKEADSAIKTSDSGLSYKIENAGQGDKVKSSDRVKIRYTGKLVDGTVFDESSADGVTLPAGNFVPGFTEGLLMLAKGGKATLYIPADLAYGVDGIPQAGIGPNSTLVFDVEVLDVNPAEDKK